MVEQTKRHWREFREGEPGSHVSHTLGAVIAVGTLVVAVARVLAAATIYVGYLLLFGGSLF